MKIEKTGFYRMANGNKAEIKIIDDPWVYGRIPQGCCLWVLESGEPTACFHKNSEQYKGHVIVSEWQEPGTGYEDIKIYKDKFGWLVFNPKTGTLGSFHSHAPSIFHHNFRGYVYEIDGNTAVSSLASGWPRIEEGVLKIYPDEGVINQGEWGKIAHSDEICFPKWIRVKKERNR